MGNAGYVLSGVGGFMKGLGVAADRKADREEREDRKAEREAERVAREQERAARDQERKDNAEYQRGRDEISDERWGITNTREQARFENDTNRLNAAAAAAEAKDRADGEAKLRARTERIKAFRGNPELAGQAGNLVIQGRAPEAIDLLNLGLEPGDPREVVRVGAITADSPSWKVEYANGDTAEIAKSEILHYSTNSRKSKTGDNSEPSGSKQTGMASGRELGRSMGAYEKQAVLRDFGKYYALPVPLDEAGRGKNPAAAAEYDGMMAAIVDGLGSQKTYGEVGRALGLQPVGQDAGIGGGRARGGVGQARARANNRLSLANRRLAELTEKQKAGISIDPSEMNAAMDERNTAEAESNVAKKLPNPENLRWTPEESREASGRTSARVTPGPGTTLPSDQTGPVRPGVAGYTIPTSDADAAAGMEARRRSRGVVPPSRMGGAPSAPVSPQANRGAIGVLDASEAPSGGAMIREQDLDSNRDGVVDERDEEVESALYLVNNPDAAQQGLASGVLTQRDIEDAKAIVAAYRALAKDKAQQRVGVAAGGR